MTSTLRRTVVVLIVALALFGLFASAAYASLETTPSPTLGTSSSNPGSGADYWWRQGWGNTLTPDFEFNPPGAWSEPVDGYLLGTLYYIDRAPVTVINTHTPDNYYRDDFPTAISAIGGTHLDNTVDMLGVYQNPPAGGWPVPQAGTHNPFEGMWGFHYTFYSDQRYQNGQWDFGFGIDQTPPRAVTGLRIRTGLTSADVTTWTPAARALISWNASQTDDLSGDGYFQVNVDDKPLVPETSATPLQGRVYASGLLQLPSSVTIESMPPGKHKVSVIPVDRATNVGPATSTYFYSDPDTPTISFTSPLTNTLSTKSLFSVNASDLAGDPTVEFYLDGIGLATITAPPYAFKPDLSALSNGNHTLTATVTDHLHRQVTVTKTVSFNNTALTTGFMTAGVHDFEYHVPLSSASNPPGDKWRQDKLNSDISWGNDLHPDFVLPVGQEASGFPANDEGNVVGMLYDVGRSPQLINETTPSAYYRSTAVSGGDGGNATTLLGATIDMASLVNYPPYAGLPSPTPGAEQPVEGTWYLHYKSFTDLGWAESNTDIVRFGIDVTPPTAPLGLTASPTTDTALSGGIVSTTRVHVSWLSGDYDALSGVAYYKVLLDGVGVVPDGADALGRVIDIPGRAEPAVTIENIPAGHHTIAVAAVDRASNMGATSTVDFTSDPDTPTISWVAPTGTQLTTQSHQISVNASDLAGDPRVSISYNGSVLATFAGPPYTVTPDLSALATGTYTLSATATDLYGRQTTISKNVSWSPNSSVALVVDTGLDIPGDDAPGTHGTTTTNPNYAFTARDVNSDRQGWGNSLFPDVVLNYPAKAEGVLYEATTTSGTIDVANPQNYYRAAKPTGTNTGNTIDMQGIFNYPPPGGWRPAPVPGSSNAIEGTWYFQYVFYDRAGNCSSRTYHASFNLDVTPPNAVTGLKAQSTLAAPGGGAVTSGSRTYISWDASASLDTLSGVSYYKLLLDGTEVIPADGIIWNLPGGIPNGVTLENLTPGKHKVSIVAVDRATNESKPSSIDVYSDPDVPTITLTSPLGGTVGVSPTVSATAADKGGVSSVVFKLDGVQILSDTAAPYTGRVNLSGFDNGPHILTATVTDFFGRQVTDTRAIVLDKTPLKFTSFSGNSLGRKLTIKFRVNRPASVKLSLKIANISQTVAAVNPGTTYTFTYTYPKKSSRYPSPLSFTDSVTLTGSDSLGYGAVATGKIKIVLAKIVKLSGNRVKIIYF